MKIEINNGSKKTILNILKEDDSDKFVKALFDCLNDHASSSTIDYTDSKCRIIFTSLYLKNSLIIINDK